MSIYWFNRAVLCAFVTFNVPCIRAKTRLPLTPSASSFSAVLLLLYNTDVWNVNWCTQTDSAPLRHSFCNSKRSANEAIYREEKPPALFVCCFFRLCINIFPSLQFTIYGNNSFVSLLSRAVYQLATQCEKPLAPIQYRTMDNHQLRLWIACVLGKLLMDGILFSLRRSFSRFAIYSGQSICKIYLINATAIVTQWQLTEALCKF